MKREWSLPFMTTGQDLIRAGKPRASDCWAWTERARAYMGKCLCPPIPVRNIDQPRITDGVRCERGLMAIS